MSAISNRLTSRVVKRIEKPKPLKGTIQPARYSSPDVPSLGGTSSLDDIMAQVDAVSMYISAKNFAELTPLASSLTSKLKAYGPKLEETHKEKLDKAFQHIRNGCRDEKLDIYSRVNLLQLVEMRAMQWQPTPLTSNYYASKVPINEQGEIENSGHTTPVSQLLGPGELIKSSGKYSSPTKLPGKNYCKDEVVIRNADSGKVNPGAKERLVQITGPAENKINFAKQLIEETIRKNASPVREVEKGHLKGSTSSLTSSDSEDSASAIHDAVITDLPDGGLPYTHTVIFGEKSIDMNSRDLDMLTESKIVLESYFKKKKSLPANATILVDDFASQMIIENSRDVKSPPSLPANNEPSKKEAPNPKVVHSSSPIPSPAKAESKTIQTPVQSAPMPAALTRQESQTAKPVPPPVQAAPAPAPILKHEKRMRIEYTRQFLMDCSTCPSATALPSKELWDKIHESCSELVKVNHFLGDSHFGNMNNFQYYDIGY